MYEDLEKQYLTTANSIGKKLLEQFSPHLFYKVELETFHITFEDFEQLKDNEIYRQFEYRCKEKIYEKYSNSIMLSDSFFYPSNLCFFVIIFNKIGFSFFLSK